VRIVAAVVVVGLLVLGYLPGVPGLLLGILALVLLVTGVAGFCPLYLPFRISSRKVKI